MSKCGSEKPALIVTRSTAATGSIVDDEYDDTGAYMNPESFYYEPHLHSQGQEGDSTQRLPAINQYSPRSMITTLNGILRKCDCGSESYGIEKMPEENPLGRSEGIPPKNLVLDYKRLRKSGYFLDKQSPDHQNDADGSSFSSQDKMSNVARWLSSVSNTSQYRFTGLDKPPTHIGRLERCFVHQVLTEEGRWKRFMLGGGLRGALKFTSEPAQALTYEQRDVILEPANNKINKILEDIHKQKENEQEYEYVYGIVAFPASWRTTSEADEDEYGATFPGLIRSWLPKALGSNQGEGQLILEPYHGPTFINGSFIKSGYTGRNQKRLALPGRIMDEVKAALRVIHRTLQQHRNSSVPSSVKVAQSPEDEEMNQLTQLLQNTQLEKKSNLEKTAFVLKHSAVSITSTPQGMPNTGISHGASFRTRRTTVVSRAVRRMMPRAPTRRRPSQGVIRGERRLVLLRTNRVNPVGTVSQPRPTASGKFNAALRSVISLISPFVIPRPIPPPPFIFSANNEPEYVNPTAATST